MELDFNLEEINIFEPSNNSTEPAVSNEPTTSIEPQVTEQTGL